MNLPLTAFGSWSGGKDCCLACYRAIASGLNIRYLLNMVTVDGEWSRSHGLASRWLKMQSEAIGIPLIQRKTADEKYEVEFKSVVSDFKQKGITEGVFGDIDVQEHREWVERVCAEVGVTPHLPLWLDAQEKIINEFICLGFKAVVVAVKADIMGDEWLGRVVDRDFLADLLTLHNVTPCGEAGEYHTLVIDGPLFKQRMEISQAGKVLRDNHRFLRITQCSLLPK